MKQELRWENADEEEREYWLEGLRGFAGVTVTQSAPTAALRGP